MRGEPAPTTSPPRTALALAAACWLSGCPLPHVDRDRPEVHGLVTREKVPLAGARVARCTNGTSWHCVEYEYAVTGADGTFLLPEVGRLELFILPVPVDPILEHGFDLEADGLTYWGIPGGGIGMPPERYDVHCELAGAAAREPTDSPATARDKHVCDASGVVR